MNARCTAVVLGILLAGACTDEARPRPQNVLLITVDTLRADHLSCYGYERETSPHIDRLAADGLRFTHAQSPRAKTNPAIATLLTGLYPHAHGVRDVATPLSSELPTFAEVLRAHGWETEAIVGNYVLRREHSGLARGFQLWFEELPQTRGVPPDDVPERTAESLTDAALARFDLSPPCGVRMGALASSEAPWFLWLHYMDPHGLYDPPAEHAIFRSDVPLPVDDGPGAPGARPPRIATYNVPAEAWLPDGRIDAARVIDRYDGEIHFVDAQIGRLLFELRQNGLLDDTWVVLTADHGESFGEMRYWFEHGAYAHEATCRVPLIVHPPLAMRSRPAPGVRDADIALADIAPTLLKLLGIDGGLARAGDVRGSSRAKVFARDDTISHPVYSEKVDASVEDRAVQTKAVRMGDWKLVQRWVARSGELSLLAEELYDLARDPAEERDLAGVVPEDAPMEALRAALARFTRADLDLARLGESLRARRRALAEEDPETARRLEAMGYR